MSSKAKKTTLNSVKKVSSEVKSAAKHPTTIKPSKAVKKEVSEPVKKVELSKEDILKGKIEAFLTKAPNSKLTKRDFETIAKNHFSEYILHFDYINSKQLLLKVDGVVIDKTFILIS